jgi:hypothetical protein
MKKIILSALVFASSLTIVSAQGLKGLLNKATKKDTSSKKSLLDQVVGAKSAAGNGLSNDDIISGLKEALRVGTDSSAKKLGSANGFFKDAAIKILMPEEAKKVEQSLRNVGMGNVVDKAILSMNRAAEDAASGIGNIFWNSIKSMNVSDGLSILKGGDFAATEYLKRTTTAELTEKFRPVIEASLIKVDATKHWKEVFSKYNMFSSAPVNTDLTAYVTENALKGLFYNISLEEQKIRKDPAAQVNDLLKKVFKK